MPVQTVTVESPTAASGAVLNASGYVVARRLATVSSKVTGRVAEVLFEEGAEVEADQVLARLERSTVDAELNLSTSGVEAARRDLREIDVRLADARKTLDHNRSLVERKLVSQSVLDSSAAEVAALSARLEAARAEVDVAKAQVGLGKQQLADLEIRAPFKGVVISKDAQPGEMVSPMSAGGGFTRTGVATIVDMDSREVEVDVNESYINRVSAGQKVECVLDAYPDLNICARHLHRPERPTARRPPCVCVSVSTSSIRASCRTWGSRSASSRTVRPRRRKACVVVPENAVIHEGDASFVWVVRDGKVEKRAVKVGSAKDDQVPVTSGLEGGETIVVDPSKRLRDGRAVELKAAT